MPRATDELRSKWTDRTAIAFLERAGYVLRKDWHWTKPTPDHKPTDKESEAMWYLVTEWDFGGFVQ